MIDFQTVARIAASRGLNTFLEGLALAGLSWGVLRCFGARSSMTRFAVWFSTLLVIAGLPLMSFVNSATPSNRRAPELTLSSAWAAGLFVTWAVIAGVLLARLGFSLWHVYKLRRECKEIEGASGAMLAEIVVRFSSARRVKVLVSDEVRVPTALGFCRPAVLLPAWALRELSADELKTILLHELAHLRRWDDWTNLAQKFVKAIFFFHPAVWWIDSRLALEREMACDDIVLEQSENAKAYATSLVSVAEKVMAERTRAGRALALAQSALGRVREVSLRLAHILDMKRDRTSRGWRPALGMIGTLALIAAGAMPYAPELIVFRGRVQPAVSAASPGVASIPAAVIPAHWTAETTRSVYQGGQHRTRTDFGSMVVPAKTKVHKANRAPRVVMAKAPARNMPTERLLALHSTQVGTAVWTLSVWQVTSADGEQQTIQEVIVMNSI
jgi:beta-lactamase regulating signal transducer with metallopeptidase domain